MPWTDPLFCVADNFSPAPSAARADAADHKSSRMNMAPIAALLNARSANNTIKYAFQSSPVVGSPTEQTRLFAPSYALAVTATSSVAFGDWRVRSAPNHCREPPHPEYRAYLVGEDGPIRAPSLVCDHDDAPIAPTARL